MPNAVCLSCYGSFIVRGELQIEVVKHQLATGLLPGLSGLPWHGFPMYMYIEVEGPTPPRAHRSENNNSNTVPHHKSFIYTNLTFMRGSGRGLFS